MCIKSLVLRAKIELRRLSKTVRNNTVQHSLSVVQIDEANLGVWSVCFRKLCWLKLLT